MRWYNDLVVRTSQSPWLFINSFIFAFGSLAFVFMNINKPFRVIVGAQMFDFQNNLTVDQIFVQLANYDESARSLYHAFLFIDFYFPFFAGLVMAAAGAFAWRHRGSRHRQPVHNSRRSLFQLPALQYRME